MDEDTMNAFQEAERVFSTMTLRQKAQVLQWVVRDLGDAVSWH